MRSGMIIVGALATAALGGCVSGPLPPGTLVGARPVYYAPPPPPRCYIRETFYGPERVCPRRDYYY